MCCVQQLNWINSLKMVLPTYFDNVSVIKGGSCDINGNFRGLFTSTKYVGVDVAEGPGVDVISPLHLYETEEKFDVVLSTSQLEHDMYWKESLKKMVDLLKPGGMMILCVCFNWFEHGTPGHKPEDSLTSKMDGEWKTYYRNVTPDDIRSVLDLDSIFKFYELGVQDNMDTRFWGIKK